MYIQKLYFGQIIRESDNKVISPCENEQDTDLLEYVAWLVSGNTPTVDYSIPVNEAHVISAVQDLLDKTAQSRGYDSMLSLCSYLNSSVSKFHTEATAGLAWRDTVWSECYTMLDAVKEGTSTFNSIDEVLNQLTPIVW